MSVITPPRPPVLPPPPDPEALIEEARRRARRRRQRLAGAALALAAGLAIVGFFGFDHRTGTSGPAAHSPRRSLGVAPSVGPAVVVSEEADLPDPRSAIWRVRPDGSAPVRLGFGTGAAISPDGRWIAFTRQTLGPASGVAARGTGRHDLFLMPARGGPARLIQHFTGGRRFDEPVWSPDSRHLLSIGSGAEISAPDTMTLIDVPSGRQRFLGQRGVGPDFSPDGREIVATGLPRGSLVVYDLATRTNRRITTGKPALNARWGRRWIAFARGRDVWLVRPDGSGLHRLTHTGAGIYPVSWSADGRRLLAAETNLHDGRAWAVEVPSGQARPLTPRVVGIWPLGLSRDGGTVLTATGCGAMRFTGGTIETIPFAGGRPHVIARTGCRASWNS